MTRGKITAPAAHRNGEVTKLLFGFIPVYDVFAEWFKKFVLPHTHTHTRMRARALSSVSNSMHCIPFFYSTIIIY